MSLPPRFLARSTRTWLALGLFTGLTAPGLAAQDVPGIEETVEDEETREPSDEVPDEGPAAPAEIIVTAARHEGEGLLTPYAVSTVELDEARLGGDGRNIANALSREPGVLMQKTGPGQSSPYVRGFTGFRTLWLIDGIRLNNSVWREGPNQYGSTVDLYSVNRLELVRGPASALWGSDAIGGTINAIGTPADASTGWHAGYQMRYATAERSFFNRLEFEGGEEGRYAIKGGVTSKHFGTIKAGNGSGDLRNTGYDELDGDLRLDMPLDDDIELTVGWQSVRQDAVPRTHKTIQSVPFHGTDAGTELKRDLDQKRDLAFVRLAWDAPSRKFYDEAAVTFSLQRNKEEQTRRRTGGRLDKSGFDVHTTGVQMEMLSDTDAGLFSYGFDYYHDRVNSHRKDWVNGVSTGKQIQGPVADDAQYDLLGIYIQDEIAHHDDLETTLGLRWTYARAKADKIDNPNVAGNDPATPGNVLDLDRSWNDFVGSVRTLKRVDRQTSLYAGLSQGFRAPNLSDLTSDLEDSGAEQPTPDLDPEYFLQLEVGAKAEHETWSGEVGVFYTWIRDMIVRSPTGEFVNGVPVVQKDNVGDGSVYGVEVQGERALGAGWSVFAVATYIVGHVDQFKESGQKVSKPLDRSMPLTAVVGVELDPDDADWWLVADVLMAAKADKLSLRDETDTERIPPGGTPGYGVFGVRGGMPLDERSSVGVAIENILDKDYRVHGSGQNEPGRNLVFNYRVRF